jgi:hypothetical protein
VASVLAVHEGATLRLGVPVALTEQGAAPTAAPYQLPPPILEEVLPPVEPLDDEELRVEARDALSAAGIVDLELVGLHGAEGWPLLAEVASTDGEEHPSIWLFDDDGLEVARGRPMRPITVVLGDHGAIVGLLEDDR